MTDEVNEMQVCYKHNDRKTLLRCNKCGRPICLECAVQTPTGYRCKECIKEQQKVFNTSETKDYIIGGLIAGFLGFVGSFVDQILPLASYLSALIIGFVFGKMICSLVRSAVNKRRSNTLNVIITAAAGIGAAIPRISGILLTLSAMFSGQRITFFGGILQLLFSALYIIVLCMTIWSETNGMVFRR